MKASITSRSACSPSTPPYSRSAITPLAKATPRPTRSGASITQYASTSASQYGRSGCSSAGSGSRPSSSATTRLAGSTHGLSRRRLIAAPPA
ncbi:hypothetical protein G6F22_018574 [Rhizopus arrhizus]|uniref:Uncharacterized protein n=1 Tax=Rhizopus delemar TaxID=936053 RepID=A0A9P6XNC1_9FUNG|nr:hypothetical protein G6F22_018574 [Rhizopus arrhizus]KAG1529366.1 hypothetical protein G6F50_018048 [Rhizopus delemar]